MPTRNHNQSYTNNSYPRDMPRYINTYTYILGTRQNIKPQPKLWLPPEVPSPVSWYPGVPAIVHTQRQQQPPLGVSKAPYGTTNHIYHRYLNNDIWYAMHVCRGGIRSNAHPLSTCQSQTNRYQINARAGTPANMGYSYDSVGKAPSNPKSHIQSYGATIVYALRVI